MPRYCALALCSLVLAVTPAARSEVCKTDTLPAATLLLPYFEVSLAGESERTTLFSVNNSGPRSRLVNVVVWMRPCGAGSRLPHLPDRLRHPDHQPAGRSGERSLAGLGPDGQPAGAAL